MPDPWHARDRRERELLQPDGRRGHSPPPGHRGAWRARRRPAAAVHRLRPAGCSDRPAGHDGRRVRRLAVGARDAWPPRRPPPGGEAEFAALCAEHGVPAEEIGTTGGLALEVTGSFAIALDELAAAHRGTLPRLLG